MRDASSRKDYLTESGDGLWSRQSGRCNRAATFSGIAIQLPGEFPCFKMDNAEGAG